MRLRRLRCSDAGQVQAIIQESTGIAISLGTLYGFCLQPCCDSYVVERASTEIIAVIAGRHMQAGSHIDILAVDVNCRKQGLATALINAFSNTPAAVSPISLEVRASNAIAKHLYSSLGYVESGLLPRFYPSEDGISMVRNVL